MGSRRDRCDPPASRTLGPASTSRFLPGRRELIRQKLIAMRGKIASRYNVRQRLLALAGNRATQDGVLIITSRVHRTQEANRAEARARLNELIASAQVVPKTRRPSRPTFGSKVRRLTAKSQRSSSKKLRGRANDD
jgi:protein subunit release factor B